MAEEPSWTGPGMSAQVYQQRRTSFEKGAAAYDRVRPDWPAKTVDWLLGNPEHPSDVLDLGAGTGKGTTTLVELGHRVTAVDPSRDMLTQLRANPALAQVRTVQASAEELALPDDSFDAIVAFQAWHWVEPEVAGPVCARLLRPGGVLGLAWHAIDARVDWVAGLLQSIGRAETPEDRTTMSVPGFADAPFEGFSYEMRLSPLEFADQVATWSHVAIRPDRDQVYEQVRALAESVTDGDGLLDVPHRTSVARLQVAS